MGVPPYPIVHTNKAWAKLTGFKFTEVANKTNTFLQGPHTEPERLQVLQEAVRAGQPTTVRLLNYTKSGDPFYNTLTVHPLRDVTGVLTHFCGELRGEPVADGGIPRLERLPPERLNSASHSGSASTSSAEEEEAVDQFLSSSKECAEHRSKRKRSRIKLAEALSNSKDAIVLTQPTPPYAITHVNQPWSEMCGYTIEEVEGLTNSILQGPETDQGLLDELMSHVRKGDSASTTLVNYKKGGVRFINQLDMMPVYNEHDELEQFMSMLHEVDETPSQSDKMDLPAHLPS